MTDTATLKALELVAFRQRGQNRVHFALVMPDTLSAGNYLGADVTLVKAPVTAWCNRIKRGDLFVIPRENLNGWKRNGHVCRECQLVAATALRCAG